VTSKDEDGEDSTIMRRSASRSNLPLRLCAPLHRAVAVRGQMSMSTLFDLPACKLFDSTSRYRYPHAVERTGSGTGSRSSWLPSRAAVVIDPDTLEHAGVLDDVKARPGSVG
jgi:hypothetical protein